MTTIDKLDINTYIQYARRTQLIEQINRQYRLDQDVSIPSQVQVLNLYPQLTELDILMGVVAVHAPWALFFPPKRFRMQRRSPFSFSRIAPSMMELSHSEAELKATIDKVDCRTPEEVREKETLLNFLKQMKKINEWLSFIVGRMGQFLQG